MEQLTRRADWQARLAAYISAIRRQPFSWRYLNCGLFIAGAVEAQTGVDFARGWRGCRTEAEVKRRLVERGFADHVALVAALLPEVPPGLARPGDVAVMPGQTGPALGIVQGARVYGLSAAGLGLGPRAAMLRAFRV